MLFSVDSWKQEHKFAEPQRKVNESLQKVFSLSSKVVKCPGDEDHDEGWPLMRRTLGSTLKPFVKRGTGFRQAVRHLVP